MVTKLPSTTDCREWSLNYPVLHTVGNGHLSWLLWAVPDLEVDLVFFLLANMETIVSDVKLGTSYVLKFAKRRESR